MELSVRLELTTYWLQVSHTTNCATTAHMPSSFRGVILFAKEELTMARIELATRSFQLLLYQLSYIAIRAGLRSPEPHILLRHTSLAGWCMSLTQKIFAINGIVAEGIGLEPMPRKDEERISNPLQYQLCLTLHITTGSHPVVKQRGEKICKSEVFRTSADFHTLTLPFPLNAIRGIDLTNTSALWRFIWTPQNILVIYFALSHRYKGTS